MDKCFDDHTLAIQLPIPGFESLDFSFNIESLIIEEKIEVPGNQMLLPFYSDAVLQEQLVCKYTLPALQ